MDLRLQYLVPPGFVTAPSEFDPTIATLGASLRGADTEQGAHVPNTPLTIRLLLMLNGAGIEFDYDGKLSYINICCFEKKFSKTLFTIVERRYQKYGLSVPRRPILDKWIHLIPVNGPMPELEHSMLSQKLTVSFYWAAYAQMLSRTRKI